MFAIVTYMRRIVENCASGTGVDANDKKVLMLSNWEAALEMMEEAST